MTDRDDANLRQFKSRSQQPKITAVGPANRPSSIAPPVSVYIVFDQGFGSVADQIDDTRFKYVGTTPGLTRYESMCSRRAKQNCMRSSFQF